MGRRPPPAHATPGGRVLTLPLAIGLLAVLGAGTGGASWAVSHRRAAGVTGSSPAGAKPLAETRKPASTPAAACHHEKGPFHVIGTVVTGSTGRYIPYGINLTGLAHTDYAARMTQDEADIAAAVDNWCANTVRFQVRQANLVSITGDVNQAFLNAVTTEVHSRRPAVSWWC